MFFENSPYKANNFLDTYDDNDRIILPTYTKGGGWLNTIGISNSLCVRATRLITNHAPIGEYRARFFPNKANSCACNNNQLEARHHKGYNYVGYVLSKIVDFLQTNRAFYFLDSVTYRHHKPNMQLRPHHTPPSRRYAPDIGLFVALRVLVLVCLLQNRNAESKKKTKHVPRSASSHNLHSVLYDVSK